MANGRRVVFPAGRGFSALMTAVLLVATLLAPAALPGASAKDDDRARGGQQEATLREISPSEKDGQQDRDRDRGKDRETGTGAAKGKRPITAEPKIVGGSPVASGTLRFMAFLHISDGSGTALCGGSLISPSHILTAAHCVEGMSASGITAYIGGNAMGSYSVPQGSLQRKASAVAVHPNWDSSTRYDAAVITLSQAVPPAASGGIDPIGFVGSGSTTGLGQGTPLTVAGWGTTSYGGQMASQLMAVSVPVQTDQYCAGQYGSDYSAIMMFCAGPQEGGRDSCQGDSGGPIFYNSGGVLTQVGVVSFGYGCAWAGYPGIYSRLANASINSFVNGILGNPAPPPPTPGDITPPTVRISNPTRNKLVRSTFTVNVAASDAQSGIRRVELQQCLGTRCVHIANDVTAPFSFRLTGQRGKATIRVIATDGAGNTTTSIRLPFWIR